MKTTSPSIAFGGFALALLLAAAASATLAVSVAQAQLTKIFVASTGNDANDGSRGSPKRNFQAAHDSVAADGEIVALDTAGYGALTVTKGVGITVPPGVNAFITTASGNGITINAATQDVVRLRGLVIEGSGPSGQGIQVNSVGLLEVADSTVRRFFTGILFSPSASANLQVVNTTCRDCSVGLNAKASASSVKTRAVVSQSRFLSNIFGVGATSLSSAAGTDLSLLDCEMSHNANPGIFSEGPTAITRVDHCRSTYNNFGLASFSGGILLSLGNNTVMGNTTDNNFTGSLSTK